MFDDDVGQWFVVAVSLYSSDLIDHVHTFIDLSEDGVDLIQPWCSAILFEQFFLCVIEAELIQIGFICLLSLYDKEL